jgi:DNA-binding NtrC family response regulator
MAHILIVDDEPDMLAVLDTIITEKTSHKVTTATNPLEAPKLVKEGAYDLAATNLRMPGMDGIGVIDGIRKIDKYIPVLMITGYSSTKSAEEVINKGAYDYITKPFRKEQVLIAINRALRWRDVKKEID